MSEWKPKDSEPIKVIHDQLLAAEDRIIKKDKEIERLKSEVKTEETQKSGWMKKYNILFSKYKHNLIAEEMSHNIISRAQVFMSPYAEREKFPTMDYLDFVELMEILGGN